MTTDLLIRAPDHRNAEFAWVCEVFIARWLGLTYRIERHALPVVQVQVSAGAPGVGGNGAVDR